MLANIKILKDQLSTFFKSDNFTVQYLDAGASVRKYYLLTFNEVRYFPGKDVVLMWLPKDRLEIIDDYLNISYYLRRQKIPRPRVYEIHRESGWIFLEPARGFRLDLYIKNRSMLQLKNIYRKLVDFLIHIQTGTSYESHCPAFTRFFDVNKYMFEFNFHVREQLVKSYYAQDFKNSYEKVFLAFAQDVSTFLDFKIPLFVHRDFQSSNIFFTPHSRKNSFQIIDFQDARSGNPVYDLVSLLWDSYVIIPDDIREWLQEKFYHEHPFIKKHFDNESYKKSIDYTIIQRKLHDAGAFIYTFRLTRNNNYLKYIDEAVNMAKNRMALYPGFQNMVEVLVNFSGKNYD
jgi:aminoglycoside/choline kinase family phosphotransferase